MSAKFSSARRAAFFKALSETGNITVSAERAKVSRSWVQLHRSTDPEFDSACRASLDVARSKLLDRARDERSGGKRGANRPPSGWGFAGGEELVVKGTRSATGRRVQVARARLKQWTPRAERRFLEALAATCNVKAACAEVGLTQASAYAHRKRWPAFADKWDQVIDDSMWRIEAALLEAGGNPLSAADDAPIDVPIREMSAAEALYMLEMHKRRVGDEGRTAGRSAGPAGPADYEKLATAIERSLDLLDRRREAGG
ncbi:MAG: hypothetical protein ACK4TP_18290, partial [Hyphomicrobium sp.]